MIKSFLRFIVISVLIITNSCNSPTEPEPLPGRRDYVWKVDTLQIPFTSLIRIWGSGPDNIWAIGPGGDLGKTIYHYDGVNWKTDGISRPISPLSVFGFNAYDVWLGGGDGRIWQLDGNIWKQIVQFYRPREKVIGFSEIWGDSPSNIFATGYSGYEESRTAVIAHYKEAKWKLLEFPGLKYNFLRIKGIDKETSKYYLMGIKETSSGQSIFGLFEFNGTDIKQIYEGTTSRETYSAVQQIDGKIYFVIGNTIYRYINNEFKEFVKIDNTNFYTQIFGRSKKDIFLRMLDGIAHYNGSNIEYLYRFNGNISITDA
ncbi:MAG: hypothetical protein FJ214_12685, partial [Ignavibacteria bacterium]|nr:hypothetical protein [Ignavibacteria bacterium]